MATPSSILAWRIPWREEPGGLQSMGSQRVGHDRATNTLTLYSDFLSFVSISIFCSWIPSRTSYYMKWSCPLNLLFIETLSQAVLAFDLDIFQEHWSGILQSVPQSGFAWHFLTIRLGLWVSGRKTQKSSAILITLQQGYIHSRRLITRDVDLNLPAKVVSVGFLYSLFYFLGYFGS